MFGELRLVRALTDAQIAAMRDPSLAGTAKLPTIEDSFCRTHDIGMFGTWFEVVPMSLPSI